MLFEVLFDYYSLIVTKNCINQNRSNLFEQTWKDLNFLLFFGGNILFLFSIIYLDPSPKTVCFGPNSLGRGPEHSHQYYIFGYENDWAEIPILMLVFLYKKKSSENNFRILELVAILKII